MISCVRYYRNKFNYLILYSCLILFIFLSASNNLFSQTWKITFNSANNTQGVDVIETYDKGYLFVGNEYDAINTARTILIKTDINGHILWKKYIGIFAKGNTLLSIEETSDGGFIIGGVTEQIDNDPQTGGDPCILKLNSCGEYQWAVIYSVADWNYATRVKILKDNTYTILCNSLISDEQFGQNSTLLKTDSLGNIIWQNTSLLYAYSFIITKDSSFLLTGFSYKPDLGGDTSISFIRSTILKINSKGQEIFYKPFGIVNKLHTIGMGSTELSTGELFSTCGSYSIRYDAEPVDYLIKSNKNGASLWHKWIGDTNEFSSSSIIIPFDDSLSLILSTKSDLSLNKTKNYISFYLLNNEGKMKKVKTYKGGLSSVENGIKKTSDNKFIICGTIYSQSNKYEMFAMKIKPDLELDSFDLHHYHYDSLCLSGIDTTTVTLENARIIPINIDSFSGISTKSNKNNEFIVYPNPAKNHITIKFKTQESKEVNYFIYDLMGKLVQSGLINNDIQNEIDIRDINPGAYILKLNVNTSNKVVKIIKHN